MTLQPSQHWQGLVSSHHPLSSPLDTVLLEWRMGADKSPGVWLRRWGQTAPTGQPVGMANSTKNPPRRELTALAGRSLRCPSAPLHADLQLSGRASRERGSSCGSAAICSLPATSRFSRGPDTRGLPFPASRLHLVRWRWETGDDGQAASLPAAGPWAHLCHRRYNHLALLCSHLH